MSQRNELIKLIVYYGSHRVYLRLARDRGDVNLGQFERAVAWAMHDIRQELDRIGVPR